MECKMQFIRYYNFMKNEGGNNVTQVDLSSPGTKNHGQQSHPYVEPIFSLPEVGRPFVCVELGRDLKLARQRVQDSHTRFGSVHGLVVDDVIFARPTITVFRFEPFFLDPVFTKTTK